MANTAASYRGVSWGELKSGLTILSYAIQVCNYITSFFILALENFKEIRMLSFSPTVSFVYQVIGLIENQRPEEITTALLIPNKIISESKGKASNMNAQWLICVKKKLHGLLDTEI